MLGDGRCFLGLDYSTLVPLISRLCLLFVDRDLTLNNGVCFIKAVGYIWLTQTPSPRLVLRDNVLSKPFFRIDVLLFFLSKCIPSINSKCIEPFLNRVKSCCILSPFSKLNLNYQPDDRGSELQVSAVIQ